MRTLIIAGATAIACVAASKAQAAAAAAREPSIELPPELARVLTDYEKAWSQPGCGGAGQAFRRRWIRAAQRKPSCAGTRRDQ